MFFHLTISIAVVCFVVFAVFCLPSSARASIIPKSDPGHGQGGVVQNRLPVGSAVKCISQRNCCDKFRNQIGEVIVDDKSDFKPYKVKFGSKESRIVESYCDRSDLELAECIGDTCKPNSDLRANPNPPSPGDCQEAWNILTGVDNAISVSVDSELQNIGVTSAIHLAYLSSDDLAKLQALLKKVPRRQLESALENNDYSDPKGVISQKGKKGATYKKAYDIISKPEAHALDPQKLKNYITNGVGIKSADDLQQLVEEYPNAFEKILNMLKPISRNIARLPDGASPQTICRKIPLDIGSADDKNRGAAWKFLSDERYSHQPKLLKDRLHGFGMKDSSSIKYLEPADLQVLSDLLKPLPSRAFDAKTLKRNNVPAVIDIPNPTPGGRPLKVEPKNYQHAFKILTDPSNYKDKSLENKIQEKGLFDESQFEFLIPAEIEEFKVLLKYIPQRLLYEPITSSKNYDAAWAILQDSSNSKDFAKLKGKRIELGVNEAKHLSLLDGDYVNELMEMLIMMPCAKFVKYFRDTPGANPDLCEDNF